MGLTEYQKTICQLIASNRIQNGESYIAGGTALNLATQSGRLSRDIDLFHDTSEALRKSWSADRQLLDHAGYQLEIVHERPAYVEAIIRKSTNSVLMQWTRDSAFRFFPLVQNDLLGLTLHPLDLATNKTLALAGRLEARDWVDMIYCHGRIQNLGYLIWAASGKDPGFNPASLLEQAARSGRYSSSEIENLVFQNKQPDAAELARKWHTLLKEAETVIRILPADKSGACIMDTAGKLYSGYPDQLKQDLDTSQIYFHHGSIRGAFPEIIK